MELKGTKTEKNLQEAFSGESQARNKYTYFASVAKKEGYEQIAALFLKTADNEKEHAKIWFKLLHGGEVPSTEVNLEDAANGEVDAADDVTSIIDGLIDSILRGTDAGQMNRKKCVELVRFMDEKGIFLVKGAIDKVAARLGVSKVTIYSYLDEAKGRR